MATASKPVGVAAQAALMWHHQGVFLVLSRSAEFAGLQHHACGALSTDACLLCTSLSSLAERVPCCQAVTVGLVLLYRTPAYHDAYPVVVSHPLRPPVLLCCAETFQ